MLTKVLVRILVRSQHKQEFPRHRSAITSILSRSKPKAIFFYCQITKQRTSRRAHRVGHLWKSSLSLWLQAFSPRAVDLYQHAFLL